jgi:hypothetical protein
MERTRKVYVLIDGWPFSMGILRCLQLPWDDTRHTIDDFAYRCTSCIHVLPFLHLLIGGVLYGMARVVAFYGSLFSFIFSEWEGMDV